MNGAVGLVRRADGCKTCCREPDGGDKCLPGRRERSHHNMHWKKKEKPIRLGRFPSTQKELLTERVCVEETDSQNPGVLYYEGK